MMRIQFAGARSSQKTTAKLLAYERQPGRCSQEWTAQPNGFADYPLAVNYPPSQRYCRMHFLHEGGQ